MGLQYMPTLTPLKPPQLIGIYGGPMERLGKNTDVENRWHSSQWTLWSLTVRESIESNPSGGLAR